MLAVSNTSPISNLAIIGAIQVAIGDRWIGTVTVQRTTLLSILLPLLHKGEAEAIALAVDLKADTIIIDEQEGRLLATQAGLSVTGVLGVLLLAKRTGQIFRCENPRSAPFGSKPVSSLPRRSRPKSSR